MTKSPPWPYRVCFWTCQNGGQAKSILIKLVLQKSPQKWCCPPGGDNVLTGSEEQGMACLGQCGDSRLDNWTAVRYSHLGLRVCQS